LISVFFRVKLRTARRYKSWEDSIPPTPHEKYCRSCTNA